jgi:hypothetical protein
MRESGPGWVEAPALADWADTCATLHMWTQIVGKVRLERTPWTNHSWHVPLYVTARGLTTSPIAHDGGRIFEIEFDLVQHELRIDTADGRRETVALRARTVADFYGAVMGALDSLSLGVRINTLPSEVADAIRFDEDTSHAAYDADAAHRFWLALTQADRVFKAFRAGFVGKCSPVHFFWGSFDLAVTRFSGRPAPPHPGGVPNLPDRVAREAYSHEVSSAGFWPGTAPAVPGAAFYSYAYPEPAGFRDASVLPQGARFDETLGEFVLAYDDVRAAADPDAALLAFLGDTYGAAATAASWDRGALEATFDL